ncbi:MAG: RNA-binding S4 domain-containing protein [Halobacteriovoraceae bacterium]|jgi:ribosome-associated protein|nr:RNA-binding S4 domain-containing protein [Halobacteriovoraceae bacterium]MBT5092820.1 RNA-binding S4 domain-containing protein [Halobacteriovoraceae bacterium]
MIEYKLEGREFIPLCDLLKRTGLCQTGGQAKMEISEGMVKVDAVVELRKRFKVRSGCLITYGEESIKVID